MSFLQNCWYMGGWSRDLRPGEMRAIRIANQPLVLFRDDSGEASAILDRCPHRFAPLHLGQYEAGRIRCAYHGLEFDRNGRCVHNPHGDHKIPDGAGVRAFPLREVASCLWVWMGKPDQADPALIPDFACLDDDTHYVGRGYLHANADYRIETDNIMDLSHIEYLHPGTLGSSAVSAAATKVSQNGTTIWSKRRTSNERLPEFLEKVLGFAPGTHVDRQLDVRWDPPASMLLYGFSTPTGSPDTMKRGRLIANIFSPETDKTTHYWFAISYAHAALGPNGAEIAQRATDDLRQPFCNEDLPMIEAVQDSMGSADFWSLKPLILAGDAGAVRARRVLDKLLRDEQRAAKSAAPEAID